MMQLPGKFVGTDILDAFRNAATLEIEGVQKWTPATNKTRDGMLRGWEAYCAVWSVPGRVFKFLGARPAWSSQDTAILVNSNPPRSPGAVTIDWTSSRPCG